MDNAEILRYISIPLVASLIGYGTNVLAIVMTFAPLEYFGFGEAFFRKWGFSLGWQGELCSLCLAVQPLWCTAMQLRVVRTCVSCELSLSLS